MWKKCFLSISSAARRSTWRKCSYLIYNLSLRFSLVLSFSCLRWKITHLYMLLDENKIMHAQSGLLLTEAWLIELIKTIYYLIWCPYVNTLTMHIWLVRSIPWGFEDECIQDVLSYAPGRKKWIQNKILKFHDPNVVHYDWLDESTHNDLWNRSYQMGKVYLIFTEAKTIHSQTMHNRH